MGKGTRNVGGAEKRKKKPPPLLYYIFFRWIALFTRKVKSRKLSRLMKLKQIKGQLSS